MFNFSLFDYFSRQADRRVTRQLLLKFKSIATVSVITICEAFNIGYCQDLSSSTEKESEKTQGAFADSPDYMEGLSKTELIVRASSLKMAYAEVGSNKLKQKPHTNVVLHIKSQGGSKFQKIEIDKKVKEQIEKAIPDLAKQNYQALISNFEKELHKTATIPLCKESKVKLLQPMAKLTKQQANKLQPVLMLQKDLLPQDEKIAYGITTQLMSFDVSTLAGLPDFLKMTGFSCLPSRMHVTKHGLMLIEGEDAIKNYDQDEKGRLDKGVERLWQALIVRYRSEEQSGIGNRLSELEKKQN